MNKPLKLREAAVIGLSFVMIFQMNLVAAVEGEPTIEDFQNTIIPNDTFLCVYYGQGCKKDSQICTKNGCENVFLDGEDREKVCCQTLANNDSSRDGLIEVCKYRLGSIAWMVFCEAKYPEMLPVDATTTGEALKTTTVAPTQPDKEQQRQSTDAEKNGYCVYKIAIAVLCTLIGEAGIYYCIKYLVLWWEQIKERFSGSGQQLSQTSSEDSHSTRVDMEPPDQPNETPPENQHDQHGGTNENMHNNEPGAVKDITKDAIPELRRKTKLQSFVNIRYRELITASNSTEETPTVAEPTISEPTSAGPTVAGPTVAGSTVAGSTVAGSTSAGSTVAEPTVAEPTAAEPTVAEPTVAEPTAAEPTVAGSTVAGSTVAGPTVAEPTAAEPTVAEPTVAEPTVAEPTVAEPTVAEPTVAEPTVAEPTVAEPTVAGSTSAGSTVAGPTSAGPTSAGSTSAGSTSAGSTSAGPTSAGSTTADIRAAERPSMADSLDTQEPSDADIHNEFGSLLKRFKFDPE